jgi:hypothetical protein
MTGKKPDDTTKDGVVI